MNEGEFSCLFIGIILGVVLTGIIFAILNVGEVNDKIELGQAICEENYDGNYRSYSTSEGLVCSTPKETEQYDGIKVKIVEES